jgi:hypothetical protein
LAVELYITDDKSIFYTLLDNKEQIELELGTGLEWLELPDRKASRILITEKVDFDDRTLWNEQFEWLIEVMLKMKKVFKKYI